jgi:hypothetical protein
MTALSLAWESSFGTAEAAMNSNMSSVPRWAVKTPPTFDREFIRDGATNTHLATRDERPTVPLCIQWAKNAGTEIIVP